MSYIRTPGHQRRAVAFRPFAWCGFGQGLAGYVAARGPKHGTSPWVGRLVRGTPPAQDVAEFFDRSFNASVFSV